MLRADHLLAPWMPIAGNELGVREVKGVLHNDRILEYLASCDRGTRPWLAKDETAWCSAFANWCMQRAGYRGTFKLNARSWLRWGVPVDLGDMRPGDVVVLWRLVKLPPTNLSGPGHVGFFVRWADCPKPIVVLRGGNQGNVVSDAEYPASRIVGVRRPLGPA